MQITKSELKKMVQEAVNEALNEKKACKEAEENVCPDCGKEVCECDKQMNEDKIYMSRADMQKLDPAVDAARKEVVKYNIPMKDGKPDFSNILADKLAAAKKAMADHEAALKARPSRAKNEIIYDEALEDASAEEDVPADEVDDHFTKQDVIAVAKDVVEKVKERINANEEQAAEIDETVENKLKEIFPEDAEKEEEVEVEEKDLEESIAQVAKYADIVKNNYACMDDRKDTIEYLSDYDDDSDPRMLESAFNDYKAAWKFMVRNIPSFEKWATILEGKDFDAAWNMLAFTLDKKVYGVWGEFRGDQRAFGIVDDYEEVADAFNDFADKHPELDLAGYEPTVD